MAALQDKIRGGWAGKMIGVAYGFPTEFKSNGQIFDGEIAWREGQVADAIGQDDLYVGMTMAETMDRLGLDATTEQYGEAFKQTKYGLWHANAAARRALNFGVKAPMSGHPKHNIHANDIDFQIEADFIGLMCPGLPRASNFYCDRVGRVMNYGDGLYGGMFVCGMYSAAYFEIDPEQVVRQGLACLPAESEYARLIADVLRWSREEPEDWRATWGRIEEKWDKHDSCIEGAGRALNIDAKINGGYVALGLLYGRGDFHKTIEIATRAGQDSDCNPSTAAGILGVMVGFERIPQRWTAGVPAVENTKFLFTNSSLNDICDSTLSRARLVVEHAGGSEVDGRLIIPRQDPESAALEQWSMGTPRERVFVDDPSFQFQGDWRPAGEGYWRHMIADSAGAEVRLTFDGAAIGLEGFCFEGGGRADVYIDGQKAGTLDSYAAPITHDDALWHTYGLRQGRHELRLVVLGAADPRATGAAVKLRSAIAFDSEGHEHHEDGPPESADGTQEQRR